MLPTLGFLIFISCLSSIICNQTDNNPCGDNSWYSFKEEKCYKLIKEWKAHDEAQQLCNQLALSLNSYVPTLVIIETFEQQQFLSNLLFNELQTKSHVWIGAKRIENSSEFVWDDDSRMRYTNWAENSPSSEHEKNCAIIQSYLARDDSEYRINLNGQWRDVTCSAGYYVLCQKLQVWSFPQLQNEFLIERKNTHFNFDDMKVEIQVSEKDRNQLNTNANAMKSQLSLLQARYESLIFETISELNADINALKSQMSVLNTNYNELKTKFSSLESKCITELRFSESEKKIIKNGPGYIDISDGYVITGVSNPDQDQVVDEVYRRQLQNRINGSWSGVKGM